MILILFFIFCGIRSANLKNLVTGSVIQEKEEEFTRSLYALQQQPTFNLMLFENEIDKIRLCVAEVCDYKIPFYINLLLMKL